MKKSLLLKTLLIASVLSITLVSSCRRDFFTDDTGFVKHAVPLGDVKDAQQWFEGYVKTIELDDEFKGADFVWRAAKTARLKNGFEAVLVPIMYPNSNYAGIRKLVINKGYNGKYYHKVIEVRPAEEYVKKKGLFNYSLKDYSGLVLRWDLKKGFRAGVYAEEGDPLAAATLERTSDSELSVIKVQMARGRIYRMVPQPNNMTNYLLNIYLSDMGWVDLNGGVGENPCEYDPDCGIGEDDVYLFEDYFTNGGTTTSYYDLFYDGVNPDWLGPDTQTDMDWYPFISGTDTALTFYRPDDSNLTTDLYNSSPAPLPAGIQSCTTQALRDIADAKGWTAGKTTLQINRMIGKSFEEAVLKALGTSGGIFAGYSAIPNKSHYSQARDQITDGGTTNVIPDMSAYPRFKLNPNTPNVPTPYNPLFIEIKAVNGTLFPSHSNHQLTGMIDVLNRKKESGNAPPVLLLVTTTNTQVSAALLNLATAKGVIIMRSWTYLVNGKLVVTMPVPLNWPDWRHTHIPEYLWLGPLEIEYPVGTDVGPDYEEMIP